MSEDNTIEDLRDLLFNTMKKLKEGTIDVPQAKAMTNIAQAVINSAKVEVDFIRAVGGIGTGTGFIPLEPKGMKPKQLKEGISEMCQCTVIETTDVRKDKKTGTYYHVICNKQMTK